MISRELIEAVPLDFGGAPSGGPKFFLQVFLQEYGTHTS